MTDRAKTINELSALTSPAGTDKLVVERSANSSVSQTGSMTVDEFLGNVSANVTVNDTGTFSANTVVFRNIQTPADSNALTIAQGTIFFDENYIYVATSTNVVKRAALSTF